MTDYNNKKDTDKAKDLAKPLGKDDGIVTDPLGSYTGVTDDGEKPIQDADDL